MTNDTVESNLGNSIWVMLTNKGQQTLVNNLGRTTNYFTRLAKLHSLSEDLPQGEKELTLRLNTLRLMWDDVAYPNRSSGDRTKWSPTDLKSFWYWTTFPHPAGWPKQKSMHRMYLTTSYAPSDKNYSSDVLYMPYMSNGGIYYGQFKFWYLLVYSDLLLPPLDETVTEERESDEDLLRSQLKVIVNGNKAAHGKWTPNEAAKRHANLLLRELNRGIRTS